MIASKSFKTAQVMNDLTLTPKTHLKPLKRTLISLSSKEYWRFRNIFEKAMKTYRVKNPRWVSLKVHLERAGEDFTYLRTIPKCKSLHFTSIKFTGSQVGFCVGHFDGEIRNLAKKSRYLRKLQFSAGVLLERRFLDLKHWILEQKNLRELSIVPYWYNERNYEDIDEYEPQKIEGVSDLLYRLSTQLKRLTLVGMIQNNFASEFDFSLMNKLEVLCIQAASRPNSCDGEPTEFSIADLKIIKKVLTLRDMKRLVLVNDYEITRPRFWESFSKLISQVTRPLEIDVEIRNRYGEFRTSRFLKTLLQTLQSNIKFRYRVIYSSYSLCLPEGTEIIGNEADYKAGENEHHLKYYYRNEDYDDFDQ